MIVHYDSYCISLDLYDTLNICLYQSSFYLNLDMKIILTGFLDYII